MSHRNTPRKSKVAPAKGAKTPAKQKKVASGSTRVAVRVSDATSAASTGAVRLTVRPGKLRGKRGYTSWSKGR